MRRKDTICGRCNLPITFTNNQVNREGIKFVVNFTDDTHKKIDHWTHDTEEDCRRALREARKSRG